MKILIILIGLALIFAIASARSKKTKTTLRLNNELAPLVQSALDLSAQDTALPVQIFQLASKFAPHPNKDETIAAIHHIYNSDQGQFGFGRRVSLSTLRFIGSHNYSADTQKTVDTMIFRGLDDDAVWVRYDAAWVARALKSTNSNIVAKLKNLQEILNAQDIEADSAEDKLRQKINEFFE